jgi:ABC-type dipeptide/oligopeptide/nickel transport system permease component
MVTGAVVMFLNMLAQILGEILDPRMEYDVEVEA